MKNKTQLKILSYLILFEIYFICIHDNSPPLNSINNLILSNFVYLSETQCFGGLSDLPFI